MTTPWDRIDANEDGPAFKIWLKRHFVTADEFNGYDLKQRVEALTMFGNRQLLQQQQQRQINSQHQAQLLQPQRQINSQHQAQQLQEQFQDLSMQPQQGQQQQITVEYEHKSISKIYNHSVDQTSTSQMGWRRERLEWIEEPIFLREHLGELKNALDGFMSDPKLLQMFINGPPGSGKTTYCLFYFTLYIRESKKKESKKKGLIVQYREFKSEVMILEGELIRRAKEGTENETIGTLIRNIMKAESFDFCVFDGMRQSSESCKNIRSVITNNMAKTSKIIMITSLEFDNKGGESTDGLDGIDSYFSVNSWKYEDYEKAFDARFAAEHLDFLNLQKLLCLDSDFLPEDEIDDGNENTVTVEWLKSLLKRKYFYAGGSARFMFDTEFKKLIPKLSKLYERMSTDDWKAIAQLTITPKTPSSVNTAIQRIEGKYIPVSEYFLHFAHSQIKSQLTTAVRAAANVSSNPSLQGWAFKLEQLDIIDGMAKGNTDFLTNKGFDLVLQISSEKTIEFDGGKITDFGRDFDDIDCDCFTISCGKWNQECFDIAFYINKHLITMNFTIAKSHSLKINAISTLRSALISSEKEVNKLTHIAVVEKEERCKKFSFSEPEFDGNWEYCQNDDAGRQSAETLIFSLSTYCTHKITADNYQEGYKGGDSYGRFLEKISVLTPRKSKRKKRAVGFHFSNT